MTALVLNRTCYVSYRRQLRSVVVAVTRRLSRADQLPFVCLILLMRSSPRPSPNFECFRKLHPRNMLFVAVVVYFVVVVVFAVVVVVYFVVVVVFVFVLPRFPRCF